MPPPVARGDQLEHAAIAAGDVAAAAFLEQVRATIVLSFGRIRDAFAR